MGEGNDGASDGPTTLYLGDRRLADAFHTERRVLAFKAGMDVRNTEMFEYLLAFMKERGGRSEFAAFVEEYVERLPADKRPTRSSSGGSDGEQR